MIYPLRRSALFASALLIAINGAAAQTRVAPEPAQRKAPPAAVQNPAPGSTPSQPTPRVTTPKLVPENPARVPESARITGMKTAVAEVSVNFAVGITVQTQGQCGQFKLDFGDGATGTSASAAVSTVGGAFFYTFSHSYSAPGQKTVTATGTQNCAGTAAAKVQVVTGPVMNPGAAAPLPPPFVLVSVSYGYPYFGVPYQTEIAAKAVNGAATVPYTSIWAPKALNNSTVVFSFKSNLPNVALSAFNGIPYGGLLCQGHQPGSCPFKFRLLSFDGDIETIDFSTVATRYASSTGPALIEIHIPNLELGKLFKAQWRYTIQMEWTHQGVTYKTSNTFLQRGDEIVKNYFEQFIYPTFRSDRCSNCHSMGDRDAIIHQHDLNGVHYMDGDTVDAIGPGPQTFCLNCHYPPHVTDWRTPPFSKGINWRTMQTWQEICNTVVAHLTPAPNSGATLKGNLWDHFHKDPRVRWAIGSAETFPGGYGHIFQKAPPGSLDRWFHIIDPWIDLDVDRCHAE